MNDALDDMLKDFVVEALELAVDVEEKLLQLERFPNDPEAINAIFRSFPPSFLPTRRSSMPTRYIDQPVFSPSEVQAFFQEHRMNLEQWPQVAPPAEVVEEYKKEVALNQEFFKDMVDPEMLSQLSKGALEEAEDPCPLIRTKWGVLFASHSPSIGRIHGHLAVQIYVAPAWRHKDFNQARTVVETLLQDPIKRFNARWRAAGAPKGNQVRVTEGINGALVSVNTYFKPAKNDKAAKDAGSALAHFFVWLCMHDMLDEVIQYAGRDFVETETTGSMVAMLPNL